MATLIPLTDETSELAAPKAFADIPVLLGRTPEDEFRLQHRVACDGSSWWYFEGGASNDRANLFLKARGVIGRINGLYGPVLYLSPTETKTPNHWREVHVPIPGKTFDVKESLKGMGARWDPLASVWLIAASKLPAAITIVKSG